MRWLTYCLLVAVWFPPMGAGWGVSAAPPTIQVEHTVFQSEFPNGILVASRVTAPAQIAQARLFVTLDSVMVYSSDALIPVHAEGEPITLEARWNGRTLTRDPSPPWMPLQFWWQITDYAGNQITTPPQQQEYTDAVFRAWTATSGNRVTVYTYGQSADFIQTVVSIGDEAMNRLQSSYGYTLPFRPSLVFYNTAAQGDADIGGSSPPFGSFIVGRAYPGSSGVVMLARFDRAFLQRTIVHELAHLFQYQIGPRLFDAPHWWIEGDAKAQEPPASIQTSLGYAQRVALDQNLPDLAQWDSRAYASEADLNYALQVGASFVIYLRDVYGYGTMAQFYANWGSGQSFEDTFISTFGQPLATLDQQWRAWLVNQQQVVPSPDQDRVAADISPAVMLPEIPNGMARVNAYWLNFRSGPSLEHQVVALLNIGQLLLPIGRDESADWLLVELPDGTQGWLFSEFVDYDGDIQALTVSLYMDPVP